MSHGTDIEAFCRFMKGLGRKGDEVTASVVRQYPANSVPQGGSRNGKRRAQPYELIQWGEVGTHRYLDENDARP